MNAIRLFLTALLLVTSPWTKADGHAYVAIIIVDLGHSLKKGQAFIDLPAPLTIAILPHTAYSKSIATSAHAAQKEIIVHLPIANVKNTPIGPGGLTANQPRSEFLSALDAAIEGVPHAQGINNHTGSYLTQQLEQMTWLMSDMKQRDFFFIDSRTTPNCVARKVAENYEVFSSSRDVFLDNERTHDSINHSFQQLISKAKQEGTAIGIGHPYPETLAYLKEALPRLAQQGIVVVPASNLIAMQNIQRLAPEPTQANAQQ